MKTSIATVCLSGGLSEKLEAIAAAGFNGVEISESDLLSYSGAPEDLAGEIKALKLEVVSFQPFADFEGMPEPQRSRAFERAERKFDVMKELGCDLLLVPSNAAPESEGGVDRAAADLRELGERAAKRGIRIAFAAMSWGRHISDYRDAWEIVRRADHPAVGLAINSFHACARKTDLKTLRSIPGDRIFLVQLADAPRLDMDLRNLSRHFLCFPGQGDLPLDEFVEAVQATGYAGYLSLETFNDQFRAGSPRQVANDGQRSLLFLLDRVREKRGVAIPGLPAMPRRSVCDGVEFIEFAVDDRAGDELAQLFAGLGFQKAAQHKSKAVTRWTQGSINLVINREKEGFAHSHFIMHGPSVAAFGLKVKSAADTLERAEKLRDTPFRQKVGPGELEIPCVRGLGGSLIYFLDAKSPLGKVWDIEFEKTGAPTNTKPAGLTVVDHISQSMHYEEFLSWLLFYTSLLDVRKTPQLDINDPGGIVRSQVVETPEGTLRIPLNGSQSQRTQSSLFLNEYFGSGVQHVAFATDDIVAAVSQMKANGVDLLPIPENYYDDLVTRADLPADRVKTLQANNILYDKDENGEYLQAYTKSFKGLFFFEFVERRGYKGFGAINAPVRLAAQSRLSRDPSSYGI